MLWGPCWEFIMPCLVIKFVEFAWSSCKAKFINAVKQRFTEYAYTIQLDITVL